MSDFLHHYVEILSDPAHLAVEVTIMLVVDFLFLGLIWPFARKYLNGRLAATHRELDLEHGVDHAKAVGRHKK